jgi:hypothetical protein
MAARSHTEILKRTLFRALGLGVTCSALVPAVACGGKVEVARDGAAAAGGGGAGGQGSGGADASTGSGFGCDAKPPPGETLVHTCLPLPENGLCPPHDALSVYQALQAKLNQSQCDPSCCTQSEVASVPCGPSPVAGACCYDVEVATSTACEGRPFTVGGEARTAMLVSRGDWGAPLRPACEDLDDVSRATLAEAWTRRALDEHASIASFARFVLELSAIGAPAELVEDAISAQADEVRHARLCFGLASAYAGSALGPGALPIHGALPTRPDLAAIAEATVHEGCIGETLASLRALDAGAVALDPAVGEVLATIARDEATHAALAFRFVAWALEVGGHDVRVAVERAFADVAAPIPPPDPEGLRADVLRAHGRVSAVERYISAVRTIDEVVRPAAAALLGDRRNHSIAAPS